MHFATPLDMLNIPGHCSQTFFLSKQIFGVCFLSPFKSSGLGGVEIPRIIMCCTDVR